jgi:predicted metal-dependent TIM-barrel fold hydrolase
MNELKELASELGGEFYEHEMYIMIRTPDNTSNENYDDLIEMVSDIKLNDHKIVDCWADHDTQIINFEKSDT